MSHDGISFEFPELDKTSDVPIQNEDAVVEKYFWIYKNRREEEMDWRLRRVIEAAYHDGFMAGQMSMQRSK